MTDRGYYLLKYISDHQIEVMTAMLAVSAVVSTAIVLNKTCQAIGQITNGVRAVYEGSSDQIYLPEEFKEIEMGLRQIQLEAQVNIKDAQEANQRKNDMIMYMAHDLKTPLTSIIGYLSLVNDEKELPASVREKYTAIALKKAQRLEDLINGFFDITRFNFTHMILEKSTINMSMMLSQIISEFESDFREKELTCSTEIANNVMVTCDTDKMERVYDNLLKNIVNYSYPKSEVFISLEKAGDSGMRLITVNKGKTIPEEMLEHIFEQFFRLDGSRNSRSGGSGLGLAVAKEIVSLHGGTIQCKSENEEIEFEVILH
ncbi:MAG: sensor histidine kinase [Anaerovoracaceae bacterium]